MRAVRERRMVKSELLKVITVFMAVVSLRFRTQLMVLSWFTLHDRTADDGYAGRF